MKTKHLIFTLLALLTSITSSAYDFSQSGLYYNITSTSAKTVAVAGRTANSDDYLANLVIPSQVTYNGVTYNVTAIASQAFSGHEIHDVTLPEGILSIGQGAFSTVPIYEVKIPASVQVIGNGAFGGRWDNCPEGEDYCWVYYPGKYTVDSNNQTYASAGGILYNKERTRLIDVPCGLNQDIYIPTTLEEMPSNAFHDCGCLSEKNLYIKDLTKFCQINVVGGSGNSVYGSVFSHVNKVYNLETFYWSDGGSHQEYVEITSTLTIPENVKTIGRGIFSGWKTLSKVNFPSMGVTQIGDYAFAATKITQVTLPASIQTIGQNAFYQQWEEYVYDEDGDWSDTNIWTMAMSSLTIPQNVQSIGSNAFNLTNGAIVTSKNNTPNNISSNAFKNASNCTLTVGQGLQSTYSQKTGWNAFGTIEEDEDIIPYIDGEVFTATTPDGLKMTFKVLSASEKTVQVGDGKNAAIDQSYEGDVIIPIQINGLTVKKIGDYAFKECKHLHFVDIPEDVLLGNSVFYYASMKKIIVKTAITSATFFCANIGELILEGSVSYGGYEAFYNTNINRLEIKPSDTALTYSNGKNSYAMFQACNIGTAIIERHMYSGYYGSSAKAPFYNSKIDSLYVKRDVSVNGCTIGDIFFEGLSAISNYRASISRVHFSEGVSTIGSQAFSSSFANNIILPASLNSIGDNAISISSTPSVTSLAQTPPTISETSFGSSNSYTIPLYVPQGSRELYASATGWNKFTNIVELCEPENVIAFADEEAKKWCLIYYDLNGDAEIDENEASCVTSLIVRGNNADKIKSFDEISYFRNIETFGFRSCSSLQSITLPSFITTIDQNAFYYCSGLTSITIPNSVTSIGEDAFYGCSGLTSITIPNSVTSIGTNPFSNCSGLTSISVASGNTTYDSRNNCNAIIETDSNALIVGCENTVIPNSVTSIGNYAFYYCTGLTSIDIPNSVTSIGYSAFNGSGLTSVVSDIETPFSFGSAAFNYISSACVLTVPAGTRDLYINKGWTTKVFRGGIIDLSNPDVIYLEENDIFIAKTIEGVKMTFKVLDNTQNTVQVGIGSSSNPAIDKNTTGSVTIPEKVIYGGVEYTITSIGAYAFTNCSQLTSVSIPSSVNAIGKSAFYDCRHLSSVNIPEEVTAIYEFTFYYCYGLTSITIPNSVTSIGEDAFYGCSGLTSVTIGSGVTSIGNYAFYFCSSLTSFTNLSKTPQSISSITFSNRPNVTLYVPKGRKAAYEAANYWKDFKEIIEISDAEDGDIDGDGEIDVADIQHIINMIVGTEDITTAADLNGDGDVDIADIQAIINIIISNANASVKAMMPKRNQKEKPNEDYVTYEQANNTIDVSLNNDFTYSAFQMKVTLPEDVDITAVDFSNARMGDLSKFVKKVTDGQYIIMGYSLDGYTIEGSENVILTIHTSKPAQEDIAITDVVFSTPNAVAYKLPVVGGRVTGVKDIVTSSMKVVGNTVFIYNAESDTLLYIYSLNGSLVNRQALHHGMNSFVLPRGQYVINKQKVFIGK